MARRFHDYLTRLASPYLTEHTQTLGFQKSDCCCIPAACAPISPSMQGPGSRRRFLLVEANGM